MTFASIPPVRRTLLLLAVTGLPACAGSLPNVDAVDVPRLQSAVAAKPGDTDLQVQLGMAQFKARDFDAARATLQGAVDAGNESGAAYLYLGMVQEELSDWSAARDAYSTYLTVGASSDARARVRQRLTLIGKNLLRAQSRQALAREAEITSTTTVTPQSVAVLPMGFNSSNADMEPLIYAISDMMVTDFKVSNALTVLERAQIQSLLDEMALTSQGYAEPGTGARAGRLLRAEHVVQGVLTTLGDNELQTVTDVLDVPSTSSAGQLTESAALERLFDMEKQIVIRTIREILALELTPAEEQRILDNRVNNVLAFLAYGRGLRELDLGNYQAAQGDFQLALQLEGGGFDAARVALGETASLIAAEGSSTDDLADAAGRTGETGVGAFGPPSSRTTDDGSRVGINDQVPGQQAPGGNALNTLRNIAEGVDPTATAGTLDLGSATLGQDAATNQTKDTSRQPVQEGSNDDVTNRPQAQVRLVIRRPGGQP